MFTAHQKHKLWLRLFACIGLGLIWAFAFPKWNMVGFAWLTPACLIVIGAGTQGKSVFGWAYLASWTHAATSLYWLLNMPHFTGALAGWFSLSAYVALFPALWTAICWHLIYQFKGTAHNGAPTDTLQWLRSRTLFEAQRLSILGAVLWVGMEWIVSNLFTGFPWLLLGASQLPYAPLAQTAALGGVPMISFIVVWTSLATGIGIARTKLRTPGPWTWLPDTILPVGVTIALCIYGYQRIQSIEDSRPKETFKVALIQPAFPQTLIWNSLEDQSRFEDLLGLSKAALQLDVDLLVWPEGAFPGNIQSFKPMKDLLNQHQAWFCFNGTDVDFETLNSDHPTTFNAAFFMNPSGQLRDTYHKRHLVMFGEYVPLHQWFPILKILTPIQHLFTAGKQAEAFHLPEQDIRLFPLICFEDVMPHLSHQATHEIDCLLNLTNDGWFKESAAQFQHAGLAAFRSIETGLPMIRCGNNGLTCWVDPAGRINTPGSHLGSEDIYSKGFRIMDIPKGWKVPLTLYQNIGRYFSLTCFLISCILILAKTKKKTESPSTSNVINLE